VSQPAADVRPLASRLVGDTLRYAPAVIVPAAVSVASVAVFTRLLDTDAYGLYSVVLAIVSIVTVVGSGWIEQAVLRYLPEYEAEHRSDELVGYAAGATAVTCSVVALSALVAARLLSGDRGGMAALMVPAGALMVGEIAFAAQSAVLQARLRSRSVSVLRMVGAVLRFALAVGFVLWIRRDVRWLLIGAAIGRAVTAGAMLAVVGRERGRWLKPRFDGAGLRRLAAYGVPMVGWALGSQVLGLSDRFVIGAFRGPGPVGIYSANYNLVSMGFGLLSAPLLMAAHPLIVTASKNRDRRDVADIIASFSRLYVVVVVPVLVVLAVCSRDLVDILLAPDFREGSRIIPVLVLGSFAWGFAMYGHKGLELAERTGLMFGLVSVTAVFNLALNFLLVPAYGYPAAAWTTLASYLLYPVLVYRASRRLWPWRIPWATVVRAAASGLLAGALAVVVRRLLPGSHPAILIVAVTAVTVSVYAALMALRRPRPPGTVS
jgi:O-antigen/teichoic acid export membrane protein